MTTHEHLLDEIERHVARRGFDGLDGRLRTLAETLVRTGTLPVVAGIIADPTEPDVVRARAFARAAAALRRADHTAGHRFVA